MWSSNPMVPTHICEGQSPKLWSWCQLQDGIWLLSIKGQILSGRDITWHHTMKEVMCSQCFVPLWEENSCQIFENKGHLLHLSDSIRLGVCWKLINEPYSLNTDHTGWILTSKSSTSSSVKPSWKLTQLSRGWSSSPSPTSCPVILGLIAPQSQVPWSSQQTLELPCKGPSLVFFPLVCQIVLRLLWLKYLGPVQCTVFHVRHQPTWKSCFCFSNLRNWAVQQPIYHQKSKNGKHFFPANVKTVSVSEV